MFYQDKNSSPDVFRVEMGKNLRFPLHLHGSFEWITVLEGEMCVAINGREYLLGKNESVLVFPHQSHALFTPSHSRHILCIFSPDLVRGYRDVFQRSVPENNLFSPPTECVKTLLRFRDATPGLLQVKGLLYSLCGAFDQGARYLPRGGDQEGLLIRIFDFVETRRGRDCSLKTLSQDTGYHYVYLSRRFKESTGLSFTEYVNRYRVNEACSLLKNSEKSVLQIAYDCGFDSLRSFNRNFKAVTGLPPAAYRTGSAGLIR